MLAVKSYTQIRYSHNSYCLLLLKCKPSIQFDTSIILYRPIILPDGEGYTLSKENGV